MGLAITAAAGVALYPPLIKIGTPLVCSGELKISTRNYSYKPGQRGTQVNFYCVNNEKKEVDVTFLAVMAAGVIYSCLWFLFLLPLSYLLQRIVVIQYDHLKIKKSLNPALNNLLSRQDNAQRLSELERLKEKELVTEEEYKLKRAEIIKSI